MLTRLLALLETFAQLTWSSNLRPLLLPLPLETFAKRPSPSKVRRLLLPLPLGEGWSLPRTRSGGEGLPGNHPGVTQRSLLAPRPRLFPIFRRGRFQTGLFRSRHPHPTPSPRPRTQPIQRRPAAPSQPQPSSPTRQKIRPKLSLASLPPLGAGWREIAPPSPPPDSRCPESRPQLRPIPATAGCRASASPPSNHAHPAPAPWRYTASDRQAPPRPNPRHNTPRAASRVFWKKLLLRARAPDWRARRLAPPSTHTPQTDILNPPPIWAVICGGHTSS